MLSNLIATSQELIPINPNAEWLGGYAIYEGPEIGYSVVRTGLSLDGTESINDTTYYRVVGSSPCLQTISAFVDFYVREENGKYYLRESAMTNEFLMLDFSLEVGDSIRLEENNNAITPNGEHEFLVESIEMITLGNGTERRKWTLRYLGPIDTEYYMEWIEGIGDADRGLWLFTPILLMDAGIGLRCYFEDGALAYERSPSPFESCCDYINVMENETEELSVSPNPFNDLIKLESSEILKTIIITDLSSRVIFEKTILSSSCQLNLAVLPTGVYILHTLTEHGTRKASRIVKQ
jgi:hypothetical protein